MLAREDSYPRTHPKSAFTNDGIDRDGLDYVANTTSSVTKCLPIIVDCELYTNPFDGSPIPYHCSDVFNGDLYEIPPNGIERLRGWNTVFFNPDNGSPQDISIASQLNPFNYYAAAVMDSVNIQGFANDSQVSEGTAFGVGDGCVGLAISCTSTVYDVTYSLVDGDIRVLNTTLAAPSTASVIKAPI
ncbi:hypothetical protein G6011_09339 [Alternaria panax]|uniref:Uncharacterized protein n=1 Tax=Alternaria panax TaxID=48097 RepID=A0AAD4IB03_9PLEO|nr:hypothetical protein G6011_09339 [Alternaria panax]